MLRSLCVAGALFFHLYGETSFHLKRDWTVEFPAGLQPVQFASGVCPGGTLYIATKGGRIISVDTGGHLDIGRQGSAFARTRALACSPDGKLYVAGHNSEDASDRLLVLDPEPGCVTSA